MIATTLRPRGPGPRLLACLVLPLALGACGHLVPRAQPAAPAELPAGSYRVDPEHAALLFKIDHLGFSQLVGRFDRFDATLDLDPEQPEAARLTVLVEVESIDLNLPEFEQDLRGPDWFDVAQFPQARFVSRAVAITGDDTGRITGDLTLHGVTRPVTLEVTLNGAGDSLITGRYSLGFAAIGSLERSEFGLGAYAPAVGDDVVLEIHAEFQRVERGGS
jgi:polyisoprenoid-binding protein YceI